MSNWGLWTKKRRTRINKLGITNSEKNQVLVPDHVIRARLESREFMTPEVKEMYYGRSEYLDRDNELSKSKMKRTNITNHLTMEHWKVLVTYWNWKIFVVLRWIGSILSISSFILVLTFVSMSGWASHSAGNLFCSELHETIMHKRFKSGLQSRSLEGCVGV